MGEVFSRAAQSGAQGLATDVEYFKTIFNTATGDEKRRARNIEQARYRGRVGRAYHGRHSVFGQFLEEPTFAGFITQATSAVGQITPSAISTIAGAGNRRCCRSG